jgi:signal transduction histidine kinase
MTAAPTSAGACLRRHKDEIVERWMQRARAHVAAARAHDEETLRDSLPEYLESLADALEERSVEHASSDVSRQHAEQRSGAAAYQLSDVLLEYRLLRRTIFEALDADAPLTPEQRDIVYEALDAGIGQAGESFMRVRLSRSEDSVRERQAERTLRIELVSMLAHDLRNPLNAARLAIQLILRQPDAPDSLRTPVNIAINEIDRVDRMIEDLLDANRIRAGEKLPLTLGDCELVAVVREVVADLAATYGERFVVAVDGPIVGRCSRAAVRRLVENLATNALEYGAPDKPVTIGIVKDSWLSLSVHDEGEPLSPDEQRRLFEPFHRSRQALASGKRGWGLGLTLVRGVAEPHGGCVEVRSAPGQGVTFIVRLPIDPERARAQ